MKDEYFKIKKEIVWWVLAYIVVVLAVIGILRLSSNVVDYVTSRIDIYLDIRAHEVATHYCPQGIYHYFGTPITDSHITCDTSSIKGKLQ